jgi:hypothetical protein
LETFSTNEHLRLEKNINFFDIPLLDRQVIRLGRATIEVKINAIERFKKRKLGSNNYIVPCKIRP